MQVSLCIHTKRPQLSYLVGEQRVCSRPCAGGNMDGTRRDDLYSPRAGRPDNTKGVNTI